MKRASNIVLGLAVVVGLSGLGAGAFLVSQGGRAEAKSDVPQAARSRVPVVVTPARQMTFESKVVVSGNVQAKNCALVSARMPGPLDSLFVDEGDVVVAGETQLFQTDSVKLAKAVALARQELTVADCTVREKQASLEQTVAQNEQAAKDLQRYQELAKQNAISKQLCEQQASQVQQAEAMVKHKEALTALAAAQQEQAKLSLMIAEKDLADSLVVAPISGRVSERMKEPGEMAGAGTPVVKIEDPSVLEISVHIPEAFYAAVTPRETLMQINVSGIDLGRVPVTYKSPTVQSKLRTFEVQAVVESPPAGVVPGCLADVSIVLDSRTGVGVPTRAIQRRGDDNVVFAVENGTTRMIAVETARESAGWTEVTGNGLTAGTPIVTLGQTLVEDGTAVSLVKEAAK